MNSSNKIALEKIENCLLKRLNFSLPSHENGGLVKPFTWNFKDIHFSVLKLAKSQGWFSKHEPQKAVDNWQLSEISGSAANTSGSGSDPNCDPANIRLTAEEIASRGERYQSLLSYITSNLQNISACTLKTNRDYCWSSIVGKLPDSKWICVAPSVPRETCGVRYWEIKAIEKNIVGYENNSDIVNTIRSTIEQIKPICIYGYYGADYSNTHKYQMICAVGETEEDAIERAMLNSKLVELFEFDVFCPMEQLEGYDMEEGEEIESKFQELNSIFKQYIPSPILYRFCFWDCEYLYFTSGEDSTEKVGVKIHSRYTCNP